MPPTRGEPVATGSVVICVGSAPIAGVVAESANVVAPLIVAVTRIFSFFWACVASPNVATSSGVSVYVTFVAPAMAAQFAPDVSQRYHW